MRLVGLILAVAAASAADPLHAGTLAGPMAATVDRVIDGDTVRVRVRVWLDQELTVNVRLRGVDAPELRARCPAERAGAEAARDFVAGLIEDGHVTLYRIEGGKFFGRVIADIEVADGRDLGRALLAAGLARPYDGGRREGWCEPTG